MTGSTKDRQELYLVFGATGLVDHLIVGKLLETSATNRSSIGKKR